VTVGKTAVIRAALALAGLACLGCGSDEWPASGDEVAQLRKEEAAAQTTAPAGPNEAALPRGAWKRARVRSTDAGLSLEEREQIARLESLGYATGSAAPSHSGGVVVFDPERAQPGLNFVTSGHAPGALLLDMEGTVLHQWSASFEMIFPASNRPAAPHWRRARPFSDGDVVLLFEGKGIARLDVASRVLWASEVQAHHDFEALPDGRLLVLTRDVNRIDGILDGRPFLEDFVSVLDAEGRELRRVSVVEALLTSPYRDWVDPDRSAFGDLLHTNSVRILKGRIEEEVPAFSAGRLLLSMAVPSLIAVMDLDLGRIVWAHRGGFRHQHDPRILDNGNLLLFDNSGTAGVSRVLELDPASLEERWSYRGTARDPFYTPTCGTAQRLPNGNTLITESENGRAFEVTPGGEIVWEFFSPFRAGADREFVATLFEVLRLPADFGAEWVRSPNTRAHEARPSETSGAGTPVPPHPTHRAGRSPGGRADRGGRVSRPVSPTAA